MIEIKQQKDCCGCSACIDACPRNCVEQVVDIDGFIRPSINMDLCVDCHLCEKVCPELNPVHQNFERRALYSAYHKNEDLRRQGSSGSVFAALAHFIISNKGVVYGAAFDENLKLRHVKAENQLELKPLCRSKYLQSNTQGIYKAIKKELAEGRKVLFVGTPCQTNAVYNFMKPTLRNNLYLVDFICHGVPSQTFFDKSLHQYEKNNKIKILGVSFRTKYKGYYHSYLIRYVGKDGKEGLKQGPYTEFPYYRAFKSYYAFRDSCYHCKHTGRERASDLTIGDFWGVRSVFTDISDEDFAKGFSEVVVNTPKGEQLMKAMDDTLSLKQCDIKYADRANPSYLKCVKEGKRKILFRFLNRYFPYVFTEKILIQKK